MDIASYLWKISPTFYLPHHEVRQAYIGKWHPIDPANWTRAITDAEVRSFFDTQLAEAIDATKNIPNFSSHPEGVQHAVISMIFSLGYTDFLKMNEVIRKLTYKDYCGLSKAILMSSWAIRCPTQADYDVKSVYQHCSRPGARVTK